MKGSAVLGIGSHFIFLLHWSPLYWPVHSKHQGCWIPSLSWPAGHTSKFCNTYKTKCSNQHLLNKASIKTSQKLRIMDNGVVGNKGSHPQNNVQQIYIFYLSRLRCWCSSPSIKIIVMKAIIILVVWGGGQAAAGGMPETECTAEVVDIIVIITIIKLTIG